MDRNDNGSKKSVPPLPGRSALGAPPPPLPSQGAMFRSAPAPTFRQPAAHSTPTFRSVSMAPPAIHSFHQSAIPAPKSFLQSHSSPLPEVTPQVKIAPSVGWSWKLDKLQPVPVFHPLERTAVYLRSIPLETVTSRVSDCLKSESITTSYNNARVECLTETLLKFSIQLWQGPEDSIIVEIQRKQGCCIEMQGVRALIVEAAQSGHKKTAAPAKDALQALMKNTTVSSTGDSDCLGSALRITQRLLESARVDENRMGLESFCALTDPTKAVAADAETAARTFFSDSGLQDLLTKYFVQIKLSKKETAGSDYDDATMNYEDGQFAGCCHIVALRLLSNLLENAGPIGAQVDLSGLFWESVLQALHYNVSVASSRPLEASLSIKCLRLLQTLEPSALSLAPSEHRLHDILMTAHQFGRRHSQSLEEESERLMGRLGLPVY